MVCVILVAVMFAQFKTVEETDITNDTYDGFNNLVSINNGVTTYTFYGQLMGYLPETKSSDVKFTLGTFINDSSNLYISNDGLSNVDYVLTTRELAKLIKRSGINFTKLPDEEFDQDIMGEYSGAGVIFGTTGGVMEAALRTAYFVLTGKEHEAIKFEQVRGMEGLKEAALNINGSEIKVAIASGMKNAKVLLDQIKEGTSPYTFIEIMGCPGGCINGGGQPFVKPVFLPNEDLNILDTYKQKRAEALYKEDERQALRQSHNNTQIQQLYKEFLGEPNSHKAHELLHTHYHAREKFVKKED